jgi:hypothetical protein
MLTVGPLGDGARDLGAPTINARNIDGRPPWEVMLEIRERPPSMQEMSMAAPREVVPKIQERPPSTLKTSTMGLLALVGGLFSI